MIIEKPRCPYCNGIWGSSNPNPVYLKKIDDGWKCPQCNLEFYEKKDEPVFTPYPYYPTWIWSTETTSDPLSFWFNNSEDIYTKDDGKPLK